MPGHPFVSTVAAWPLPPADWFAWTAAASSWAVGWRPDRGRARRVRDSRQGPAERLRLGRAGGLHRVRDPGRDGHAGRTARPVGAPRSARADPVARPRADRGTAPGRRSWLGLDHDNGEGGEGERHPRDREAGDPPNGRRLEAASLERALEAALAEPRGSERGHS